MERCKKLCAFSAASPKLFVVFILYKWYTNYNISDRIRGVTKNQCMNKMEEAKQNLRDNNSFNLPLLPDFPAEKVSFLK